LPIFEAVGKNFKQLLNGVIATAAAAGVYIIAIDLERPGNLKSVIACIRDMTVSSINASIVGINRSLPAPNASWVYGLYCTQVIVYIYQPDAVARNILITLEVTAE
jgi:hypothetical protein